PFETPPYTTITQPFSLPEIDLLPDPEDSSRTPPHLMPSINPELLEALANAENLDDPHLQAVLKNIASVPPEEELLVAATLDEVTQAMGVVLDETDDDLAEMADDEKAL